MKETSEFSWDREKLLQNGMGFLPVMGEFHYSRYAEKDWEHELQLIKAGGIDIVATYVIWLHHEEIEGSFTWEGNRNLRKFIETAANCGLWVWLRIGPWVHGEVRNGGFPDWILKKEFSPRSNDPGYLTKAEEFYNKIGKEVQGLLFSEGGPVIGIQIENEYHGDGHMDMAQQHEHIRNLYQLAQKAGLKVPYYTVTAWGKSGTGRDTRWGREHLLPVYGGYCEAPWDPRITQLEANINYVFSPQRDDGNIGKDLFDAAITQSTEEVEEDAPYLLAELGGGVQVTKHRRPLVTGTDLEAMLFTKLGNGANLIGFYMYHGGINPIGKNSTFQESKETGYPNDLPVRNYDFMAPIGACGEVRDSFGRIRRLSIFLKEFGGILSQMGAKFPQNHIEDPENLIDLRYACRCKGASGFLFVNRYQRKRHFSPWEGTLTLQQEGTTVTFPEMKFQDGDYGIYPFGISIDSCEIVSANVSLLCTLSGHGARIPVFYGDRTPVVWWKDGKVPTKVFYLTEQESRNATKVTWSGKDYLFFSPGVIVSYDNHLYLRGEEREGEFGVYPPLPETWMSQQKNLIPASEIPGKEKGVSWFSLPPKETMEPQVTAVEAGEVRKGWIRYELGITYSCKDKPMWLTIHYRGNAGEIWSGDTLIADDFYHGMEWRVSLHQNGYPEKLILEIQILKQDTPVFMDEHPLMKNSNQKEIGVLDRIAGHAEYEWEIW